MSQGKYWVFTDFELRDDYSDWGFEYLCYGVEKCPTTGKMHHQGYVEFKTNQRLTTLGKKFRCNFERRRGTAEQAIEYCKKDGVFFEFGVKPKVKEQGKRTDINEVKDMVKNGANMSQIAEVTTSFQAFKFAESLLKYQEKKRSWKPTVKWYFGPTGSGKTKTAVEEAGDNYWMSGRNLKWWEGYDGHENIIIDDFRADFCTFHELLRILDRYEYRIEVKGSSRQLLAKNIWITCPKEPEEIYSTREDILQLIRRIDEIKKFGSDCFFNF